MDKSVRYLERGRDKNKVSEFDKKVKEWDDYQTNHTIIKDAKQALPILVNAPIAGAKAVSDAFSNAEKGLKDGADDLWTKLKKFLEDAFKDTGKAIEIGFVVFMGAYLIKS